MAALATVLLRVPATVYERVIAMVFASVVGTIAS